MAQATEGSRQSSEQVLSATSDSLIPRRGACMFPSHAEVTTGQPACGEWFRLVLLPQGREPGILFSFETDRRVPPKTRPHKPQLRLFSPSAA